MRTIIKINYYFQWLIIVVMSGSILFALIGLLLESDVAGGGVMVLMAALFYAGVFQLVASTVSVLRKKRKSVCAKHLQWSFVYLITLAVVLVFTLGMFDYELEYLVYLLIVFSPAFVLLINYFNITFKYLNPNKLYNETNK